MQVEMYRKVNRMDYDEDYMTWAFFVSLRSLLFIRRGTSVQVNAHSIRSDTRPHVLHISQYPNMNRHPILRIHYPHGLPVMPR